VIIIGVCVFAIAMFQILGFVTIASINNKLDIIFEDKLNKMEVKK
jgi:hypothetical protein